MLGHCICYSCCWPTQKKSNLELQSLLLGCDLDSHWHSCPGITLLKFPKMPALSHGLPIMLEQCHKLWPSSVLKGSEGRKSEEGCGAGTIIYLSKVLT